MLKKDKNKLEKIAVFVQGNIVSIGLQGFQAQTLLFSVGHGSAWKWISDESSDAGLPILLSFFDCCNLERADGDATCISIAPCWCSGGVSGE